MAFLTKKASQRKVHTVDLEKAGCKVRVRELSGKQAVNYQIDMIGKDGKPDIQKMRDAASKLIAMSVVDEHGEFEFDEESAGDLPAPVSSELVEAINEINGMTPKADAEGNDQPS